MRKLKVMVDENSPSLVERLKSITKSVDPIKSLDCGFHCGTDDGILVRATRKLNRVLLTRDYTTIKAEDYPPCTHGGIVFIKITSAEQTIVAEAFKNLAEWSKRGVLVGHLTYLHRDNAEIVTHKERYTVTWRRINRRRRYTVIRQPL